MTPILTQSEEAYPAGDPRSELVWYKDAEYPSVMAALGRFGVRQFGDICMRSQQDFVDRGVWPSELVPLRNLLTKRGLSLRLPEGALSVAGPPLRQEIGGTLSLEPAAAYADHSPSENAVPVAEEAA